KLVQERVISPVTILPIYGRPVTTYQPLLPPLRDTGVPLLDQVTKPSGAVNWHHHAMPQVADLYYTDAKKLDALHPELYRNALRWILLFFFAPASETLALYDPPTENVKRETAWLNIANTLFAGQFSADQIGWFNVILLPIAIIYGAA